MNNFSVRINSKKNQFSWKKAPLVQEFLIKTIIILPASVVFLNSESEEYVHYSIIDASEKCFRISGWLNKGPSISRNTMQQ